MDRRILLCSLAFVFALPSLADARKWTDVAGNQISAEYVRVHEGEVILRQGTRIIKCPYDKFSELDKAYLRDQMDAERGSSRRRTGINQIGGPVTPEETDDDARELRTWQDIQGRKILAQYTGFSGGRIELLKDGRRVSYPYAGFSAADQSYVAQILISEGRIDEIPKEKKEGEDGSGEGVSSDESGYGGEGPMGGSRAGRGPRGGMGPMGGGPMGGSFGPSEPDFEVAGPPSFEPPSFEPPGFHGPNVAGPSMPRVTYRTSDRAMTRLISAVQGRDMGHQARWKKSVCAPVVRRRFPPALELETIVHTAEFASTTRRKRTVAGNTRDRVGTSLAVADERS